MTANVLVDWVTTAAEMRGLHVGEGAVGTAITNAPTPNDEGWKFLGIGSERRTFLAFGRDENKMQINTGSTSLTAFRGWSEVALANMKPVFSERVTGSHVLAAWATTPRMEMGTNNPPVTAGNPPTGWTIVSGTRPNAIWERTANATLAPLVIRLYHRQLTGGTASQGGLGVMGGTTGTLVRDEVRIRILFTQAGGTAALTTAQFMIALSPGGTAVTANPNDRTGDFNVAMNAGSGNTIVSGLAVTQAGWHGQTGAYVAFVINPEEGETSRPISGGGGVLVLHSTILSSGVPATTPTPWGWRYLVITPMANTSAGRIYFGGATTVNGTNMMNHWNPATGENSVTMTVKGFETRVRSDNLTITKAASTLITGSANLAIGNAALGANHTSGSYNIALGHQPLFNSTTGGNRTAIGYRALYNATTASDSVAIGLQAGARTTTGLVVAVGNYALGGSATADPYAATGNHAFGHYALSNITSGTYNTAVGFQAGRYRGTGSTALTTASNSVLIGYNARAADADTSANQIVIGFDALGGGDNTITLGNSSITAIRAQVTTISALSDSRAKQDIRPANLDLCLDAVKALPVSRWQWGKKAGARPDKHVTGWLADDVEKVWPKAVTTSDTRQLKDAKHVAVEDALPTLWGAVQKILERLEKLEEKLNG